jgi:hypothetical protein
VAILPSGPAVAIGSTTQLKAIATFDDGSTKDVTADFAWTSSDPRTVGTSSSGVLTGLATGKTMISGSYQSHQASVAASSALGDVQWSGPIVIVRGGTYSGNWQSNDPRTPAVTVSTTEPVIVENSHIRSVSGLIKAETSGADLTVRNNVAIATNAAAKGQPNGIFLQAASPARLDVENNYIENASGGVVVHGYSGNRDGKQTIVIRANRARNLSGLLSDGNGGYLPGEGPNHSVSRFIELDTVQAVPGIDVGWNEVINYPGRSLVSDNIDVNRSSGTMLITAAGSRPRVAPTTARRRPLPLAAFTTTRWSALWAMASPSQPGTTTLRSIIVSSPAACWQMVRGSLRRGLALPKKQPAGQTQVYTTIRCAITWSAGCAGNPHAHKGATATMYLSLRRRQTTPPTLPSQPGRSRSIRRTTSTRSG